MKRPLLELRRLRNRKPLGGRSLVEMSETELDRKQRLREECLERQRRVAILARQYAATRRLDYRAAQAESAQEDQRQDGPGVCRAEAS